LTIFFFALVGAEIRPYQNANDWPKFEGRNAAPLDFFPMSPLLGPTPNTTSKFINTTWPGFNYTFTGHLLRLTNPIGHFHILPPSGGCGHPETTSANAAASGCIAASNGGFFDMSTGACIGNIITNGTVIELPATQNSNFGILKNNTFVLGYLTADQISAINASSQFLELITGVVWLVRDAVNFVNESASIENAGSGFVSEAAPRVAIGHDKSGNLMVLEVDGEEDIYQGPDLNTFADMAISLGFYNAINIDGGGSSTVVYDSVLCSSCGLLLDTCEFVAPKLSDPCQRAVTTITCFI